MNKKIKILVPYDFSKAAESALSYVAGFVEHNSDAEVILAYIKPCSDIEVRKDILEEVVAAFGRERRNAVHWVVASGNFRDGLRSVSAQEQPDLIFMGTSCLTPGRNETRASVLAVEARCPVFVIPRDFEKFRLERIALVIGSDPIHDRNMLPGILKVARAFNAKIEVVTAKQGIRDYGYSSADELNDNTLAYFFEDFYSHHVFIDGPNVGEALLEYVHKNKVDLLTILPKNHAPEEIRSQGNLTRFLCQHTETPVLVMDL